MHKKILGSVIAVGILITGFTNAVNYYENIGDYEDLGGNNNCTIKSDLSFDCSESNNVIVGTDMSWYKTSSSYFRTNSGLAMYIHVQNGNDYQGLITSFVICGSDNVGSCNTQISYQDFFTYASNYELTQWRWYSNSSTPGWAGIDFIFGTTHIYFGPNYTNNGELISYGSYTPYNFGLNGYGLQANYTSATYSPFQEKPPTYQEYSCPTIGQLIKTYGEEYNTGLCYSSNILYSGGTIQTVTPKNIFELYPTRIELNQDIQNYNTYCNNVATQQACQQIFEGKNEQYTLIAKIPKEVKPINLYQYCNLSLNYEPNQTTCTVTGAINTNTGITINDVIKEIGEGDITVVTPGKPPQNGTGINGSGSVYDELLGNTKDDTQRRNVVKNAKDIIKTMKELYAKMTGIFRGRSGKNGIIPAYITGLILLAVLYKLFKK